MADDAAPASTPKMSDDASMLHVAKVTLIKHLHYWDAPGLNSLHDNFVTAAAKDILDAVDAHAAGGGGTGPDEDLIHPGAPTKDTPDVQWADEEADDNEEDATASSKSAKKKK